MTASSVPVHPGDLGLPLYPARIIGFILVVVFGLPGMVWLGVVLAFAVLEPDGGGQLAAILRAREEDGDRNLSIGVLAIEVTAVVAFAVGTVAIGLGRLRSFGRPAPMTEIGLFGTVLVLFAVVLWGVSWVAEGLAFTNSQPWREA